MSLPEVSASATRPHHTREASVTLQEALVKLRHVSHEELEVGNGWELGNGTAVMCCVVGMLRGPGSTAVVAASPSGVDDSEELCCVRLIYNPSLRYKICASRSVQ